MILPNYWDMGIGSIVAKELIKTAREHKQIKRFFAIIDPKNIPLGRILTNNGFQSKEFKDFDGLPGGILDLKYKWSPQNKSKNRPSEHCKEA